MPIHRPSVATAAAVAAAAAAVAVVAYAAGAAAAERQAGTAAAAAAAAVAAPSLAGGAGGLLAGRVLVVTGGSSGIGREIALSAAEAGANVLVLDVTADPLEGGPPTVTAAAQRLRSVKGAGAVALLLGDTTKAADLDAAVAEAVRRWGRLDIWVNNAAVGVGGDLLTTKEDDWDRTLTINAKGYWLGARAAARQMLLQAPRIDGLRGKIINISSQHGMVCCPGDIAYGTGKAAAVRMISCARDPTLLVSCSLLTLLLTLHLTCSPAAHFLVPSQVYMTRQIAADFAKQGIVCNAVAPGKIVTDPSAPVRECAPPPPLLTKSMDLD